MEHDDNPQYGHIAFVKSSDSSTAQPTLQNRSVGMTQTAQPTFQNRSVGRHRQHNLHFSKTYIAES